MPGITTDSVAELACEALGSKLLINISKTSYLYDLNPSYTGAHKIVTASFEQLLGRAFSDDKREPGTNFMFDVFASILARRSGIEIKFRFACCNCHYTG